MTVPSQPGKPGALARTLADLPADDALLVETGGTPHAVTTVGAARAELAQAARDAVTAWSVVVVKPEFGTTWLGPYEYRHRAETAAARLRMLVPGSAPQGTTITVEAYGAQHAHVDPFVPTGIGELAEVVAADPGGDGTGARFPDPYSLLYAQEGDERARTLWMDACVHLDAMNEHAEQEAERAAAELERLEADRARIGPIIDRISEVASSRMSLYTGPVIEGAARLLDAMLLAAGPHGVTAEHFAGVTSLPQACLDAYTAVVARDGEQYLVDARHRAALLDAVVASAAGEGLAAHRAGDTMSLDNAKGHPLVTLRLTRGGGWQVTTYRTTSGAAELIAPFTVEAARSIVDLLVGVVEGCVGSPFADPNA